MEDKDIKDSALKELMRFTSVGSQEHKQSDMSTSDNIRIVTRQDVSEEDIMRATNMANINDDIMPCDINVR